MSDETEKPVTLSCHGNAENRRVAQEEAAKLLRQYEAFAEFQKAKAYCLMHQPEGIVLCVKVGDAVFRYLLDDESGRFFAVTLAQHYKLFQFDGLDGSPVSEPLVPICGLMYQAHQAPSHQGRDGEP